MTLPGRLSACLMMALLVLTGQQITMAGTSGPGVMQAVLCSGGGFVTVMLDADGNPTGPPHICPDATLAFVPDVALPRPAGRAITIHALAFTPPDAARRINAPLHMPPARGPPSLV